MYIASHCKMVNKPNALFQVVLGVGWMRVPGSGPQFVD